MGFTLEVLRRLGVFVLALVTAFAIMLMVTLPLLVAAWWLLLWASRQ